VDRHRRAPGPHFVDFDDSRTGPAAQDLWMLLSGGRQDMQQQLSDLLAGYEDFAEFNPHELELIEALRTLRLIHYSAWIARPMGGGSGLPGRVSVVRLAAVLGGAHPGAARADRGDAGAGARGLVG